MNAVINVTLLAFHLLAKLLLLHGLLIHRLAMDYKYINYYEYTRDGLNNTDKLYIVVFVYLFYHSKCLYLLFTYPYPWSIDQEFATSVTGSVGFLCEGAL